MKKGQVFFHPIDGTGALSISWGTEPRGIAIEAKKGSGVGFFSAKNNALIGVIFDEVVAENDHQILQFDHNQVEIDVKNGKVSFTLTPISVQRQPKTRKKASKRKRSS